MRGHRYDALKMYFQEDYVLTDGFTIHQPTIQEIVDYGETEFYNMVYTLCANPTFFRYYLWQVGLDWNVMTDFDIFKLFGLTFPKESTELLFGDIDFQQFREVKTEDQDVLVYLPNPEIRMDEELHADFVGYLRAMFHVHPKTEKARNTATKEAIIWEEEMNLRYAEKKKDNEVWKPSTLFPLISAALNHPGFKYTKNELRDVGIFEFMDSIQRLQLLDEVGSFRTGMYMGMMDLKKVDLKEELNWTRDMYK